MDAAVTPTIETANRRRGQNRQLVFDALAQAQKPMSAYELLELLRGDGLRSPLQVYRALDQLVEDGSGHKIESLSAFALCTHAECSDHGQAHLRSARAADGPASSMTPLWTGYCANLPGKMASAPRRPRSNCQACARAARMDKTPVYMLTGFLGAGKSTLLNRVLGDPAFADTAIIINEFGDVALDHDLVRVGETQVARTTTGCLCCKVGSDIRSTLHELHVLADAGEISFDRVIVETTGLADPAPLVNQLIPGGAAALGLRDHLVARSFELAGVVTLVDIVTGELSIENHFEASKQIAFADRIVLTKTDLARDPASRRDIDRLKAQLAALNPAAGIVDAHQPGVDAAALFQPRAYAPGSLGDDVVGWLALEEAVSSADSDVSTETRQRSVSSFGRHGDRIRTFSITRDEPIGSAAFARFLNLLAMSAGSRLLRAKGLVRDRDEPDRPRVIHVVQHTVYPPTILDAWPSEDRRTRLVFITDGIDPEPVRQLFEAALDNRPGKAGRALRSLTTTIAETFRSSATQLARALTG